MLGFFVFNTYLCKVIIKNIFMAYLGQKPIDISKTEFKDFGPNDWALEYIGRYGSIDGAHHKSWVLDQVGRILHGTPIIVEEATWDNHPPEIRFWTGEPSQAYLDWVLELKGSYDFDDEEYEYDYDEGIAP